MHVELDEVRRSKTCGLCVLNGSPISDVSYQSIIEVYIQITSILKLKADLGSENCSNATIDLANGGIFRTSSPTCDDVECRVITKIEPCTDDDSQYDVKDKKAVKRKYKKKKKKGSDSSADSANDETTNKHKVCHVCGEAFRFKVKLKQHIRDEHGKTSYKCLTCERIFISEKNLTRHTSTVHDQQRVYTCELCGKSSYHLSSFKRHKLIHYGVKKFKCELCDMTFLRNDKLKRHMFVHTGIKNFACDICGKRYSRKDKLTLHNSKQHPAVNPTFLIPIEQESKA